MARHHSAKPKFRNAEIWGACSRCAARVRYSTLRRERLTGLLVCTEASGRGTRPCWDPWPEVYDFQVYPDKSIEPPPEPLPARWNLDDIWGNGPAPGQTTKVYASGPTPAPDDATRLRALLTSVPYYQNLGRSAAFTPMTMGAATDAQNVTTVLPASYDGTFLPSGSVRTVTPPDEGAELAALTRTDQDTNAPLWTPPWAAQKGV